jgi:hypothetical protein
METIYQIVYHELFLKKYITACTQLGDMKCMHVRWDNLLIIYLLFQW